MGSHVWVAGAAEFPQGKTSWPSTMALHEALVQEALTDAGLKLDDVDALITVSPRSDPYLVHAIALAERLGIIPKVALTLEAGGTAPVAMCASAEGVFSTEPDVDVVVAVAADLPATGIGRAQYTSSLAVAAGPVHPDYEAPYGPTVPAMFALVASAYLDRYSVDPLRLAALPLQDREMASRHPNAHMRSPMSLEDYVSAPMVASPLRLFDCAPVSDGGGAVVLTKHPPQKGAQIRGIGSSFRHLHLSAANDIVSFGAGDALDRALSRAGMSRDDIDVACVYDCFSIAGYVNLEDMGLVGRGEAPDAIAEGHFTAAGSGPALNPHGGLLSHGHPARAGGMGNLIEAYRQVTGAAMERQVPNCRAAIVHGMAGVFAGHAVMILTAS